MIRYTVHTSLFLAIWLLLGAGCKPSSPEVFQEQDKDGRPLEWREQRLSLTVMRPDRGLGLRMKDIVASIGRTVDAWTAHINLDIHIKTAVRPSRRYESDGVNGLFFLQQNTSVLNRARALIQDRTNQCGVTSLYPGKLDPTSDRTGISEADILVNAVDFSFDPKKNGLKEFEALILHELGHFLGLAHNCVPSKFHQSKFKGGSPPPLCKTLPSLGREAAMYPFPLEKGRPLVLVPTKTEREKLAEIYGPRRGAE